MQDKKYLATIVPLGPQARKQIQKGENLDVIRAAVWSETAKKLTPLLGSVCSRFLPATYAWSICNYRPLASCLAESQLIWRICFCATQGHGWNR